MAVLTIQYPQELQSQKRYALGIDLGTTHSLVACDIDGFVKIFTDENNEALLPSIVHFLPDGTTLVGEAAKALRCADPKNTLSSVKRLMGRSPQEILAQNNSQIFEFADQNSSIAEIITDAGKVSPIEISAQILKKLMERVHQFDPDLNEAVITVPAYFDEAQRQATKEAARLAGISVLRLLNEPTAAAIAYGLDRGAHGFCLIYDLGGGTFDVSLLELSKGVFEVRATGGDTALGGDDIDEKIVQWILQRCGYAKHELNLNELLIKARLAKEALSTKTTTTIMLENGWQDDLSIEIFNELITPLMDKTLKRCHQVLMDANIDKNQIDQVVLVGGSTRIPLLRQCITHFFEKTPLTDLDPDKIVAMGAALQASALVGNRRDEAILLLDVIPLSLGIEMMGGTTDKILARNTPIPAKATQLFTTYQDGQTGLSLHIVQGERELAKDCRSLAKFDLTGIPPMRAGNARIEVTFQVDPDGLLNVHATELISGVQSQIEVKPTYGLTQNEITEAIEKSILHSEIDIANKKLHEKLHEAQQLLSSLENALKTDQALLSSEQYHALRNAMEICQTGLIEKQYHKITQAIKLLTPQAQMFGELRLNHTLQQALAGKTLDQLEKVFYD